MEIDINMVKGAVTRACWDQSHRCNGLICGCPCHDQDRARVTAESDGRFNTLAPIGALDGAEVVRLIFGPAVMAGNLQAAAAQGDLILIEVERRVRQQIAQDIESASFPVGQLANYAEAFAASWVAQTVLAQCARIAREGGGR